MAFDSYPYEQRLPLAYADDVDYVPGGAYATPYERSSYHQSVRAPYCGPARSVPMRPSSYESGYRAFEGYGGGRSGGFGGAYRPVPEHRSSRLGSRSRSHACGGHGLHYPSSSRGLMMEPHYGHGHGQYLPGY